MLGEFETVAIVENIISNLNIVSKKEMGKIMGELSRHPQATQIDKKFASTVINKMLP